MSVAPTSAAATVAASAAASERASKVQVNSKASDEARRSKNGEQTGDRIVLSADAVQAKQGATDQSGDQDAHPEAEQPRTRDSEVQRHLDVQG